MTVLLYVHQIWYQGSTKIPGKYQENIQTIKKNIPNCIYKCWDNTSIIELLAEKSSALLEKYTQYKYMHQKIDFARYCILYYIGGLYVDMDAYVLKSPEHLIKEYPDTEVFVSTIGMYTYESLASTLLPETINNGIIYAPVPKSTFMKNCIVEMPGKTYSLLSKFYTIQNTTGPRQFTIICKKSPKVTVLLPEFLEPCVQTKCKITKNTIVVHKHEGTWIDSHTNNLVKLYTEIRTSQLIVPVFLMTILIILFLILR
jgi:mannosyltransferase OCH1-like enzyme